MTKIIDPSVIASGFRRDLREQVARLPQPLKLVGFLSSEYAPSVTYANYTKVGCDDVGIRFEIRKESKFDVENEILAAGDDRNVHGILVYYPIFGTERDAYIKDAVIHSKDIEGLHSYWARKLYRNDRYIDEQKTKQAILPCTPLAIVKLLEAAEVFDRSRARPLEGKTVTIFNRSEVVGRPLASMLANDGALVYSFDIDGPLLVSDGQSEETEITRRDALAQSDIVVTGVPSRAFPLVEGSEIKAGATCINFSTLKNFDDSIMDKAATFIPRVGPMTVTMALRNTLRLYHNYHAR